MAGGVSYPSMAVNIIKNVTDTPPPLDESQPFFESPQIIRQSFPALFRKKSATSKKSRWIPFPLSEFALWTFDSWTFS